MAPIVTRIRIANPRRKKRAAASSRRAKRRTSLRRPVAAKRRRNVKRRRKSNPGEVTIMTKNPRKRRSSRRRNRKSNPVVSIKRRRRSGSAKRSSRRRRNPAGSISLAGFNIKSVAIAGVAAAGGAIATRGLTQMLLKDKNTGAMGYGANLLVALGLGLAAGKFVGREVGTSVTTGGIAAVVLRYWSEKIAGSSPSALDGTLGDYDFSDNGLGQYIDTPFQLPSVSAVGPNGYQVVTSPAAAAAAPPAVPQQTGVVEIGRFGPRAR